MRVASGGAAVALVGAASVVARRGGLIDRPARWLSPATWGIAAYLALNTVGNVASTSSVERYAFGPATAVASALTAVVAYRTRTQLISRTSPRRKGIAMELLVTRTWYGIHRSARLGKRPTTVERLGRKLVVPREGPSQAEGRRRGRVTERSRAAVGRPRRGGLTARRDHAHRPSSSVVVDVRLGPGGEGGRCVATSGSAGWSWGGRSSLSRGCA